MSFFTQTYSQRLTTSLLTFSCILGALVVNGLSNFFPPKGLNVGQISRQIFGTVLIIPASYAFAIWGLIYIGLITYGIYQFQSDSRRDAVIQSLNTKLMFACVSQMIWILLFTWQLFWLSVVAIVAILGSLILAYQALGQDKRNTQNHLSPKRYWQVHVPFSIYFAWISVATIVNVACALTFVNWSGWGISPVMWTIVMIGVSFILGTIALVQRQDYAFATVFVWAYGAIALRQVDNLPIFFSAGLGIIGLCSLMVALGFKKKVNRY